MALGHAAHEFTVSDGVIAVIRSLDLEVAEGELFVIVGASGSGKTTLLRCIAGLEVPDGGEVRIDGRIVSSDSPPTWIPPQQRRLGMVFQSYAVWPHLTVSQNIALPLAEGTQRIAKSEVAKRVNEALRLVQLEEQADRPATLLSGWKQQRVALARAIAVSSRLLLMDEPLSNLDARLREDVCGRIRDLAKQLGLDGSLCHPRSNRSDGNRRQDRPHASRRIAPGRHAGADLSQTQQRRCRRFLRFGQLARR